MMEMRDKLFQTNINILDLYKKASKTIRFNRPYLRISLYHYLLRQFSNYLQFSINNHIRYKAKLLI